MTLLEIQRHLGIILDSVQSGIVVIDPRTHVVVYANRAAVEMIGVPKGEVVGSPCHNFICPAEKGGCPITDLGQTIDYSERILIGRGGTPMPIIKTVVPVWLGGREYLVESFTDITAYKQVEEERNLQRAYFQQLFMNSPQGIVLLDNADRVVEANKAFEELFQYTVDEIRGRPINEIIVPDNLVDEATALSHAVISGGVIQRESVRRRKDGSLVAVSAIGYPIVLDGKQVGIYAIYSDISERKRAEEKLRAAHRQLLDIIDFLPDATFVIDQEKKVIAWNRAIEEMTGVLKEDIIGQGDYAYAVPFYGERRPVLVDLIGLEDDLRKIEEKYEYVERKANTLIAEVFVPKLNQGRGAFLWATASPLYDSDGKLAGAIESIRDITERKQMEQQLKYLSLHDALTGLYNRTYFEQEMRRLAAGRHAPVGIIICDLDALKFINDTLGHDAGDALLVAAANVIKSCFRTGDMVARIGGDEFAVLLPNCDRSAVEQACHRIHKAVAAYNAGDPEVPLSISVGMAVSDKGPVNLSELFKEADNNMYRVKLHRSESTRSATVKILLKALEGKDFITEGHAERLQALVVALGKAVGVPKNRLKDLRLLAQFHDIGKVGIPDGILFKPGPLTAEETAEIRRHSEIGYRIAQSMPDLVLIADWILKHHEWWNGEGYPLGLKGEEIPLECRILAIADAYDAMTSDRPYRKAMSREEALAELRRMAGTQFDPQLVEKFAELLKNGMVFDDQTVGRNCPNTSCRAEEPL
ncbi:PAS domain S-box protein [Desulforudis sp. 1031]|uniref:sensor domain-containing diguanylate cyclase/phosphohydrolase n=1 Tax=unclassified Candidatus Desulforudis TaxID=2635950 RepID=UPI003CE4FF44